MLIKIDHINIVNIFEYYLYTNDIFIVMDYFDGGELFNKIVQDTKYLTERSIRNIMKDILGAVAYLHGQDIGNCEYQNLKKSSL
jgi:serine/threonine protein kinase